MVLDPFVNQKLREFSGNSRHVGSVIGRLGVGELESQNLRKLKNDKLGF